jgi:hypothetical protein
LLFGEAMRRVLGIGLSCWVWAVGVACGGAPAGRGGSGPGGEGVEAPGPAGAAPQALVVAHGFSEGAYAEGARVLSLLVESAVAAGRQVGAPAVQRGTVVWSGREVRYAPEPADRLRVMVGAEDWSFQIGAAEGDARSAAAFFEGPHRLDVQATSAAGAALALTSRRVGIQREARLAGRAPVDGVSYELDLTFRGEERFDTDSTGTALQSDLAVSGWAEAPGFHLEVDETWAFELVSGTGPGGFTAQTATRTLGGGLVAGGHAFGFRGVKTRRAFRDGKPTELDTYWSAAGEVMQDGLTWAQVNLRADVVDAERGGFVHFVLDAPAGSVVLESYAAY